MATLYRTMNADLDGKPHLGDDGFSLGVTEGPPGDRSADVHPDGDGNVGPGEGMSTFTHPRKLPRTLRPIELDGGSSLPVFALPMEAVTSPITCRSTRRSGDHVQVEPDATMHLGRYVQALSDTRARWTRAM